MFFGGLLFILLIALGVVVLRGIFGPLAPEQLNRGTLIRVIQLRDFRQLPDDKVAALADRAEKEFGRNGIQRPVFAFSGIEKRVFAYFGAEETRTPSLLETNLYEMARIRYFQWMNEYERSSEATRIALMQKIVADLKYWQTLYVEFLTAAELPIPSLAKLIHEFEKMITAFKVGAMPSEIKRIDAFKRRLNAAIVASEVGGAVDNFSDNVRSAVGNLLPIFDTQK